MGGNTFSVGWAECEEGVGWVAVAELRGGSSLEKNTLFVDVTLSTETSADGNTFWMGWAGRGMGCCWG